MVVFFINCFIYVSKNWLLINFIFYMWYNCRAMANSEELQKQVEQYEEDKKTGKKKSKKSVVRYILNISFVLIVTIVSIIVSLFGGGTE